MNQRSFLMLINTKSIIKTLILIVSLSFIPLVNATSGYNVTVTGNGVTAQSTQATPGTFYYNKTTNLNVSFSINSAGVAPMSITINSGSNPTFTKQTSAGSTDLTPAELTNFTTGTYPLIITSSDGAVVSATTNIIIDTTLPTLSTPNLVIKNSSDIVITDNRSNSASIKLDLPTVTDTNFNNDFILEVALGTSSLSYNVISTNNYTIASNVATINIGPTGLNLTDNTVNFRVTARDQARNVSTPATGKFIYDTTRPGVVTNIVMRDGTEVVAPGSSRKAVTQMSWTAPANTTDISHYNLWARVGNAEFTIISSGSTTTTSVDTSGFANGTVQFKVQAVDLAGNAIPQGDLTAVSFVLSKRAISFDIQYFPSVTSGYLTVSGVAAINSMQRLSLLVIDPEPLIASYVISVENLDNDSYVFKSGTRANLQADLRALEGSPAGGYFVVVRDTAANSYRIKLNLQQVGPILPVNRSLTVTSLDTKDIVGIATRVRIQFDAATGADYYKAYVNGEETTIVDSGLGFVEVNLDTIAFGAVDNNYEIRAFTDEGNFVKYTSRNHITQDLVKPYAVINYTESKATSISFNVTITDPNNLLTTSNAVLYLNGVEVQRQAVTKGTNDYVFNNLLAGRTNYQIKILGAFRFGNPVTNFPATTVINEGNVYSRSTVYNIETLRTGPDVVINFDSFNVEYNSITLTVTSTKRSTASFDYEMKIYDENNALVANATALTIENATTSLSQTDTKTIGGLVVGRKYQLRVIDGASVIATLNFFTTKEVPTATIRSNAVTAQSLDLVVNISDLDGAISTSPRKGLLKIYSASTLQEVFTTAIDIANSNVVVSIPNLSFDTEYVARVFANYVTDDVYIVSNNLLAQETFRTAKPAPTASVIWSDFFDVTSNSITFEVNVDDPFNTLRETNVQLYRLDQKIGAPIPINRGRFSNLVFSGLQSNTEYVIIIQAKYDLNDGNGLVTKDGFLLGFPTTFFRSNVFKTTKAIPLVSVLSSGVSNESATVRLEILDVDTSFSAATVKLFKPGVAAPISTKVATLRAETFTFDQLEPNIAYNFIVEADYNLDDGRGLQTRKVIYEAILKTDADVNAVISPAVTEPTSIRVAINVRDYINQTVVARLFQGNTSVGQPVLLSNGANSVVFENLTVQTIYRIAVEYTSGAVIQLAEQTVQTPRAAALAIPTIALNPVVVTENTIEVTAVVTDADSALADVIDINVCNTSDSICTVVQRSVSELQAGVSIEIEPGAYRVSLSAPYNIITTVGVAESLVQTISLDETAPEQPVAPVTPREPSDISLGFVIVSILGTALIGFGGIFIYSFRKMYIR
jgi:hypothetical protein